MFQFFSSFGASSNFQKNRLILTNKTYQKPDQICLKSKFLLKREIIETFRGQDQQTRSQIAFATILKKIHTSDSKDNWIYLLKNLIILDRVVQDNCFIDQISTLNLSPIDNYHQNNDQQKILNAQKILKSFWKVIQQKSKLLSQSFQSSQNCLNLSKQRALKKVNSFNKISKINDKQISSFESSKQKYLQQQNSIPQSITRRNILSISRSQKQDFLKNLPSHLLLKQSLQLQQMFELIFMLLNNLNVQSVNDRFKNSQQEFFNSKLVTYLHLQMLYKLISLYTNQLFCIKAFITTLGNVSTSNPSTSGHLSTTGNASSTGNVSATGHLSTTNTDRSYSKLEMVSQKNVNQWKMIIINFLNYAQNIINYVEKHKHIKGFQLINYQEMKPFENINIIKMLDEYMQHKNRQQDPQMVQIKDLHNFLEGSEQIKVQKKAQQSIQKRNVPRKSISTKRSIQQNNAFKNWQNSYTKNFPPKQVLTLDLIIELRQNTHDQEENNIYQPFASNRHSCILTYKQTDITYNQTDITQGIDFQYKQLDKNNYNNFRNVWSRFGKGQGNQRILWVG